LSFGWVCLFEGGEAFAEAGCVLVGDREDADAALGAAGFADEVVSATLVCVGNCGVYDLDEGCHGRGRCVLLPGRPLDHGAIQSTRAQSISVPDSYYGAYIFERTERHK
jgi:hypothetical protein